MPANRIMSFVQRRKVFREATLNGGFVVKEKTCERTPEGAGAFKIISNGSDYTQPFVCGIGRKDQI